MSSSLAAIAIAISISISIPFGESGCPPDYELIDGLCFALRGAPNLNWDQANELCHRDHTRLTKIDPQQLPILTKILPRGAQAWIGLRYDKIMHKWIWTKDRSTADLSQAYLKNLDSNATEEDDCALIKLKKGQINIETDTCSDKWINSGLCSTEKEHCSYSQTTRMSLCRFDNGTCSKKAVYDIDGGSLPKHADACEVDETNCRVRFNNQSSTSVSCSLECGENVDANDTFWLADDCKRVTLVIDCDCNEARAAIYQTATQSPYNLGLYIGIAIFSTIVAILILAAAIKLIKKKIRSHNERLHPPRATVRYSVDAVKYSGGTGAAY